MNLLLILCDDLRPELGCYGTDFARTPHIDTLAKDGTRFARHYCQQGVSIPSRASLLTGVRPEATGVRDNSTVLADVNPGLLTLPRHLKAAGYTCVSIGKIFGNPAADDLQGWSEPPTVRTDPDWLAVYEPEHVARKQVTAAHPELGGVRPSAWDAGDVDDDAYRDGQIARIGIDKLGALSEAGTPFFLAVGMKGGHLPFNAPRKYWDLHDPADLPPPSPPHVPAGAPPSALHEAYELRSYANIDLPPGVPRLDAHAAGKLRHGYRACTSYADAMVGRVLDELDRLRLRDDTLVVLTSDHGFLLGDCGLWCKHCNFEPAVHVPLILRGPGVPARQVQRGLSEHVDVFPTLCDLLNLPTPDHLAGEGSESLAARLNNPAHPGKRAAFSEYPRPREGGRIWGRSVRTDRWRLTRWPGEAGGPDELELYDFADLPTGRHPARNVAYDPRHADVVRSLSDLLDGHWRTPAASMPALDGH